MNHSEHDYESEDVVLKVVKNKKLFREDFI